MPPHSIMVQPGPLGSQCPSSARSRHLGGVSAPQAEVSRHNAPLCPKSSALRPNPSCIHGVWLLWWERMEWCGRGGWLGRPWSMVSMQVTSAGTATGPARQHIEWPRSWVPWPSHHLSSPPVLGSLQVGVIFFLPSQPVAILGPY